MMLSRLLCAVRAAIVCGGCGQGQTNYISIMQTLPKYLFIRSSTERDAINNRFKIARGIIKIR